MTEFPPLKITPELLEHARPRFILREISGRLTEEHVAAVQLLLSEERPEVVLLVIDAEGGSDHDGLQLAEAVLNYQRRTNGLIVVHVRRALGGAGLVCQLARVVTAAPNAEYDGPGLRVRKVTDLDDAVQQAWIELEDRLNRGEC